MAVAKYLYIFKLLVIF